MAQLCLWVTGARLGWVGAVGLVILAALPHEGAEQILAINGPEIARHYPQMTQESLRTCLLEARERGYSVIPGVLVPGF